MAGQARISDVSCDDTARLTRTLQQVIGAERHGMGLRDPDTLLEVWVTRQTGDWVLVQSYANGTSCIVAMGADWQNETPDPA
ncbi:hypothetical protein [uncultured Roseobacter sp.]|uniref:hypothetical protein n=1 Tax=uncultured Roseobacter sp. TaxID=114847 RepID=UPI002612A310|nr:hypothetical protein [uncultured Roseobacter sp.]